MKQWLFLSIYLFVCTNIHAQYLSYESIDTYFHHKSASLKLSLIDLIDLRTPSLQFSYEQRLKNRLSFSLSYGPISTLGGEWVRQKPITGHRFRGEIRYYFRDKKKYFHKSIQYFGLQIVLKRSHEEENKEFWRFNRTTIENLDFIARRDIFAFHLISGSIHHHDYGAVTADFNFFFGFRKQNKFPTAIPSDAELVTTNRLFFSLEFWGENYFPSLGLNAALSFNFHPSLKKKSKK